MRGSAHKRSLRTHKFCAGLDCLPRHLGRCVEGERWTERKGWELTMMMRKHKGLLEEVHHTWGSGCSILAACMGPFCLREVTVGPYAWGQEWQQEVVGIQATSSLGERQASARCLDGLGAVA